MSRVFLGASWHPPMSHDQIVLQPMTWAQRELAMSVKLMCHAEANRYAGNLKRRDPAIDEQQAADSLFQAAFLECCIAAQRFEFPRGYSFTTLASHYIRKGLQDEGRHMHQISPSFIDRNNYLRHGEPTPCPCTERNRRKKGRDDCSRCFGSGVITDRRVGVVRVDAGFYDDSGDIWDVATPDGEEILDELPPHVAEAMMSIDPRIRMCILLRTQGMKLAEIGKLIRVSKERVRQMYNEGINLVKLRLGIKVVSYAMQRSRARQKKLGKPVAMAG